MHSQFVKSPKKWITTLRSKIHSAVEYLNAFEIIYVVEVIKSIVNRMLRELLPKNCRIVCIHVHSTMKRSKNVNKKEMKKENENSM